MKIDNSVKPVASKLSGTVRVGNGAAAKVASSSPQVELSSVAHLQSSGAASEAFDAKKVAEIRQAISEGRFHINPERIADGLIDSVRDMLSKQASA